MNKKKITFMSLLALCVATVGGCAEKNNVSEIVLQVGDKKYTADELFNDLLNTGVGANEAFTKVLRLVVESSMETTVNIQTSADLAARKFYREVEANAQQNGTSKAEAEKALLKEKGYKSVEELKSDVIYKQKLTRLTDKYWEENKEIFYDDFIESRLPYLVSHVLVKIDDNTNSNKITNNVNVSQKEAEKLSKVIDRFAKGDKFAYIANQESEDPGSNASGGAYYMDATTAFVDEFLYGTYLFDAYTTESGTGDERLITWGKNEKKYSELERIGFVEKMEQATVAPTISEDTGITSVDSYYQDGVNFVDMGIAKKLGEVANKTSTGDFHYIGYVDREDFYTDGGLSEYDSSLHNLNSNYNAYARSIIFNRAFNKPGISVIGYDATGENANTKPADLKNCVKFKMGDKEKWILTDEIGNPIFFVVARGSSNDLWVHFLTINVSTLQDMNKGKAFFTIKDPSIVDPDAETPETPVEEELTYVKKFGNGDRKKERELLDKLESYVKSYVTGGSGEEVGDENLLTYSMVTHYMNENKIKFANENLKNAILSYITSKQEIMKTKLGNKALEGYKKHEDKLITSEIELIKKGIKPYECAVVMPTDVYAPINDSTSTGNLCRYVYGKGYQIKTSMYYRIGAKPTGESYSKVTTSDQILSVKDELNKTDGTTSSTQKFLQWQWAFVGEKVELPTPANYTFEREVEDETGTKKIVKEDRTGNSQLVVRNGYTFYGWYKDKALTIPVEQSEDGKCYADYTESRIDNQAIYYAKVKQDVGTYSVNYKYRYKGTSIEVSQPSLINTTAPTKIDYNSAQGQKEVKIGVNEFTSANFDINGFGTEKDHEGKDIEHTIIVSGEEDKKDITVYVYVSPKPVKVTYVYVGEHGIDSNGNPDSFIYADDKKNYLIDDSKIILGTEAQTKIGAKEYLFIGENEKPLEHSKVPNNDLTSVTNNKIPVTEDKFGKQLVIYVHIETIVKGGN